MARKYTQPKKKKTRRQPVVATRQDAPVTAPTAAATAEYSVARPPVSRAGMGATPVSEAIKYENLPSELRRVALLTIITLAILVVSWLILR